MTGGEARAARKRLGLTIFRLAGLTGIPETALQCFEGTGHMPLPMHGTQDRIAVFRAALEEAGAEFTVGQAAGVGLKKLAE